MMAAHLKVVSTGTTPLSVLRDQANAYAQAGDEHQHDAYRSWIACGRSLLMCKQIVGEHGKWKPWVKKNFDRGYRTATRYMKMAKLAEKMPDFEKRVAEFTDGSRAAFLRWLSGAPVKRDKHVDNLSDLADAMRATGRHLMKVEPHLNPHDRNRLKPIITFDGLIKFAKSGDKLPALSNAAHGKLTSGKVTRMTLLAKRGRDEVASCNAVRHDR